METSPVRCVYNKAGLHDFVLLRERSEMAAIAHFGLTSMQTKFVEVPRQSRSTSRGRQVVVEGQRIQRR
jgi:hypothetical protein